MALKRVDERLLRLTSMVENWNNSGNVPRIERDMALEELRRIYDELLDYEPTKQNINTPEAVIPVVAEVAADDAQNLVEELPVEENVAPVAAEEVVDNVFDSLDIDALLGLSGDDSIKEAEAAVAVVEPVVEPIVEPVVEPAVEAVEEPQVKAEPEVEPEPEAESEPETEEDCSVGGGLFDIDDIPVRARTGRRMISLYDAPVKDVNTAEESAAVVVEEAVAAPVTPVVEPQPAPQSVVAHEEEVPQRLGDVIAKNVTTLADKMAGEQPTAAFNRIADIRKAIGLNDKFLMIRDLFGGDAKLYEQTITRLNEFDDLDECMIYIVENFRWNPDSEGAKLLVSLIERKLS